MSRWVRCSYGKRAGFVNAKVGIQFQKTKQFGRKTNLTTLNLTFYQENY